MTVCITCFKIRTLPTANIVKDGLLYLYYGVCDTAIALATVPLNDLLAELLRG